MTYTPKVKGVIYPRVNNKHFDGSTSSLIKKRMRENIFQEENSIFSENRKVGWR